MTEFNQELYDVGARIRERRKELNMTAAELAVQTNVTAATISSIENGQKAAKTSTLIAIARVLEVSLDYFQPQDLDEYITLPKGMEILLPKLKTKTLIEQRKLIQMFSVLIDTI